MPIFLSTKSSVNPVSLPFKFTGGLGLSSKTIGTMLSIQGIYSMAAQLMIFPFVMAKLGSLRMFQLIYIIWPLLYFIVPYLVLLPQRLRMTAVFVCLLWRSTAQVHSYPASAILLANSAPSKLYLGLINGIAASTASLSRAFGPTISGIIHSWGLSRGYAGFAWWVCGIACTIGAIESMWMEEGKGRHDLAENSDDESIRGETCLAPLEINTATITVMTN